LTGRYLIFATAAARCYKPVHGLISIVVVQDGAARTAAIAEEPDTQPIAALLDRIRRLIASKQK
jgi:hypothetical protein